MPSLPSQVPLTIAVLGCGSRSRTYCKIANSFGDRYQIVAGADPVPERREVMREISQNPSYISFNSGDELLAQDQLADVLIIGSQDDYHYEPAKAALKKGYHLLLEKPAAQSLKEVRELADLAKKYDRKILLCFVLRFTHFYSKVKEIIASGQLGEIITLHATEGVEAWHHAHSFVRGHWSKKENSTPMIIAKCSHDTDYISWLIDAPCSSVSSYGRISYFNEKNQPEGASDRCTSGCPHAQPNGGTCMYDAHHYLGKHTSWLDMIYPHPTERKDEDVLEWFKTSPWGRCAWKCDNNVVDHQVLNMDFKNGSTASLTMTAFDFGRSLEIHGTKASLRGGSAHKTNSGKDISIRNHATGKTEYITLKEPKGEGYQGHGGGDFGLVNMMDEIFRGNSSACSLIENSIESHIIGFAAEQSRLNGGKPVVL